MAEMETAYKKDFVQKRMNEEKYRVLYNTSRDAIMTLAPPTWKFTSGNPASIKMFNCKDEAEFISLGPWQLSPNKQPDGQKSTDKAKKMIKKAMAKGSNFFEWTHKRYRGEDFPATVLLSRVKEAEQTYLQATVRDITKQKEMENKLINYQRTLKDQVKQRTKQLEDTKTALLNVLADSQEISARDEAILASIAKGVIVVNRSGIIILMNHLAEKLLGWTSKESIGKKWFHILKREDENENPISMDEGAIKAALTTTATTTDDMINSYYYVRKDGTKFPVARTVSPIILESKIIGAINVFRDVTQEKDLDKMKSEFMDIAAHDLRTPATAIRGFISRVLDGDAGKISTKAKDLLKEAYQGNLRLIKLVDDFLTVSRLERGKIQILPKPGDLAKIIETSVAELYGLVKEKGLTIEYKKIKLPPVLVDGGKIIQVLGNLISNALKFTPTGGITIWHQVGKSEVVTNISDTGIGITAEAQKQLFQKYFKADKSINRSGLGLGLYICKLLVEASRGQIWLKSKPAQGSTFSFSLPIAK